MDLNNKRVLVLGLGITGISTIKALHKLGAKIVISDTKCEVDLKDILKEIKHIQTEFFIGTDDMDLTGVDLIIKSPGIPPNAKIVQKAILNNIEIITDIELAYRISPTENIITITGSNGKTTTTMLTGEIFKKGNYNTHVVGNIGIGILDKIIDADKDEVFVIEASSFQLEHTKEFKPKVSLILNITPDHLDWHGSFENYISAKLKILKNQDSGDFVILNYEDSILRSFEDQVKGNIIWFSVNYVLDKGIYIEGENIIINDGIKKTIVIPYKELKILGKHNLENALGSIGIAYAMGVDINIIREALRNFKGVEHRIEFVINKNGINFYNDSKGTNPDASIKAIEALNSPIVLIAGGYDKGSSYDDLILSFKNKVKCLILLGQTKEKIKDSAYKNGFTNYYLVDNMHEAVNLAYKNGESGDNVLLSPACASWGMYNNFEERGKDFKSEVFNLME